MNRDEAEYYRRHLALREIGAEGQQRLRSSSVLVIGLGGLGSPLSLYLAAAGVGRIGLVEFDRVDACNLHRQILYGSSQVGQEKLRCAVDRLRDLNPHVQIVPHPVRLDSGNARDLIRSYDVIADGADNFSTRYLVNDACVLEKKPLVSASILGFEGMLSVFGTRGGPCYRCLFPEPPPPGASPSCAENGVLGVLPGVMGCLQATEVLKVLLGLGEVAVGRVLSYDALALDFSVLRFARRPDCVVCGDQPSVTELVDYEAFCGGPSALVPVIAPQALAQALRTGNLPDLIVDVRESDEREICSIASSIHVPLGEILEDRAQLPKGRPLIIYCKSGGRSLQAAQHLVTSGHTQVRNLAGGILRWIDEIDPSLKKY